MERIEPGWGNAFLGFFLEIHVMALGGGGTVKSVAELLMDFGAILYIYIKEFTVAGFFFFTCFFSLFFFTQN
jgi:hypothetical protein